MGHIVKEILFHCLLIVVAMFAVAFLFSSMVLAIKVTKTVCDLIWGLW